MQKISDKVTLVIPTCDRPHYLHRLLTYYGASDFPIKVQILDSSLEVPQQGGLSQLLTHKRVSYKRLPHDVNIWSKIMAGVKLISTPYYVLCADDDFLTVQGIMQSAMFLDENPDYAVAQGYHLAFRVHKGEEANERFRWSTSKWPQESNELADPESRLQFHFVHYQHTFYAVQRTHHGELIHRDNVRLRIAPFLSELLPSMITAIRGKIKVLDVLYQLRESIPDKAERPANLAACVRNGTYQEKYAPFRESLATHLSGQNGMTSERAAATVDDAMFKYFTICCKQTPSALSWRRQFHANQIPWFDFRNSVDRPYSEYYDDFDRVRRHVLEFTPCSASQMVSG